MGYSKGNPRGDDTEGGGERFLRSGCGVGMYVGMTGRAEGMEQELQRDKEV
jgi:hypothetical protein